MPLRENLGKSTLESFRSYDTAFSDRNVTVNVTINLNSRQNWFMVQLSQGREIRPIHVSEHWRVSLRTAKRDLRYLTLKGLITYLGHPKRGRYVIHRPEVIDSTPG